jgi:hypothetical protein
MLPADKPNLPQYATIVGKLNFIKNEKFITQ